MPTDLLMLLGIGLLCAAVAALLKRWFGWGPDLGDFECNSSLTNSDGCPTHFDYRRDEHIDND